MTKHAERKRDERPEIATEKLRLPDCEDFLTVTEIHELFGRLCRVMGPLVESERQNVRRLFATLFHYHNVLEGSDVDPDSGLPARIRRDGVDYLYERRCRLCGCTDLQFCPGGCRWVEWDLCSQCRPK